VLLPGINVSTVNSLCCSAQRLASERILAYGILAMILFLTPRGPKSRCAVSKNGYLHLTALPEALVATDGAAQTCLSRTASM
jgi:hypothetical protein